MNDIEQFLSDICDYAQHRLDEDNVLMINLTTHTSEGEKPSVVRSIKGEPKLKLFVVFGESADANS